MSMRRWQQRARSKEPPSSGAQGLTHTQSLCPSPLPSPSPTALSDRTKGPVWWTGLHDRDYDRELLPVLCCGVTTRDPNTETPLPLSCGQKRLPFGNMIRHREGWNLPEDLEISLMEQWPSPHPSRPQLLPEDPRQSQLLPALCSERLTLKDGRC